MENKTCLYCGNKYTPYRSSQKYCSNCSKKANKEYKHNWYETNKPRILKKRSKYFQEHKREEVKRTKKWRDENPKKFKEMKHKERKIYIKKYPEKIKAQSMAKKIPLKSYCEICGSNENLERHHPNYNKPLIIITLCKSCHTKIHGGNQNRHV